jgi:hypothetical protein
MPPLGASLPTSIRKNKAAGSGREFLAKIPKELGSDEENVVLGIGTQVLAAAGAFSISEVPPRDVLLRKLVVAVRTAAGVIGSGRITSIAIGGRSYFLGDSAPVEMFAAGSFNSPDFDELVKGGATVTVAGISDGTTAVVDAGFTID